MSLLEYATMYLVVAVLVVMLFAAWHICTISSKIYAVRKLWTRRINLLADRGREYRRIMGR